MAIKVTEKNVRSNGGKSGPNVTLLKLRTFGKLSTLDSQPERAKKIGKLALPEDLQVLQTKKTNRMAYIERSLFFYNLVYVITYDSNLYTETSIANIADTKRQYGLSDFNKDGLMCYSRLDDYMDNF